MHIQHTHTHTRYIHSRVDTAPALALRLARPSTLPGGAWGSSAWGEPDGLPVQQHECVVEVGQVAALLAPRDSLVQA